MKSTALLGTLRGPFLFVGNVLRKNGIIEEGYNAFSDAYERRLNINGFSPIVLSKHSFKEDGAATRARVIARSTSLGKVPQYEVSRPGCSMTFVNAKDLADNLWKLALEPGYSLAPDVAFFVKNRGSGMFSHMPSDWVDKALERKHSLGRTKYGSEVGTIDHAAHAKWKAEQAIKRARSAKYEARRRKRIVRAEIAAAFASVPMTPEAVAA